MFGTQNTTIIDLLAGKIQTRVSKFLGCRERIVRYTFSSEPLVRGAADKLLVSQDKLEKELNRTLAFIEEAKKGNFSLSKATDAGKFVYAMERHIDDVEKLAGKSPVPKLTISPSLWFLLGGLGIFIITGRRK